MKRIKGKSTTDSRLSWDLFRTQESSEGKGETHVMNSHVGGYSMWDKTQEFLRMEVIRLLFRRTGCRT